MVYGMRNDNFAVREAQKNREAKGDEHKNDGSVNNVFDWVEVKYEVGDMVWGKMKSYPWWPGKVYNEAWADPLVRNKKKEGHVLVAFFGDDSCAWLDPKELVPFDRHYDEKSKQTNAKDFLDAVEEAENEVSMRAALGMACHCHNLISFQPISFFDWFYAVEIKGYDSSGVYSMPQIRCAREWFQPIMALSFLTQLALMPDEELHKNVDWIRDVAIFTAYRMAVFKETDETLELESSNQSKHLSNSTVDFDQQEEVSYEVHPSRSDEIFGAVGQEKEFANHLALTDERQEQTCISKEKDHLYVVDAHHFGQRKEDFCTPYKKEVIVGLMAGGRQVCGSEVISRNTKVSICQKTQSKPNSRKNVDENSEEYDNMHVIGYNSSFHYDGPVLGVKQKDFECPREYAISEKAIKANKRRKRETEVICSKTHLYEDPNDGEQESLDRNLTIEFCQTGVFGKENALISQQEKEKGACHTLTSHYMADKQVFGSTGVRIELHLMVVNLLALALDPCYGVQQNILRNVQPFFLQVRSMFYQERFAASPASPSIEEELNEFQFRQTDCPASILAADSPPSERSQGQPLDAIPPGKYLELDDYAMNHKQSNFYDLGKENPPRVQTRLHQPESLTMEVKAGSQQHVKCKSGNSISALHVTNQVQDVQGNLKPLITSAKPTILILRFPTNSALPSTSELKAKFGCIGPLDLSSTRVSWKSSTCFVAFKCQSDALTAYDYALHHKSPFGNANIDYQLHTMAVLPGESHKSEILPLNQTHEKDVPSTTMITAGAMKPGVQPKTCLKKPMETTGTPIKPGSVKFALDGNERSEIEQMVVKSNNSYCNNPGVGVSLSLASFQNASDRKPQNSTFGPSPACSNEISNLTGDDVVDEFISFCNSQSHELTRKITFSPPGQNVDISNQMFSNLIKCSEIICTLESRLGYVPYFL